MATSKTWKDHLKHLEVVLEVLLDNSFYIKLSKCTFSQKELEYLRHLISHEGVKVDSRKVKAMVAWPKPKTITELRGFPGLNGYYRKFVKDYASIAKPLTNMLKKNNFDWSEEVEMTFKALKKAMIATPILAMPNFDKVFELYMDASNVGVGAVLTQERRPLAFISKAPWSSKESVECVCMRDACYHGGREGMDALFAGAEVLDSHESTTFEVAFRAKDHHCRSTKVGI
ncbi:uncharacterized mitochondrial protein AtMg00860-like [Carya illinoinensis]|uniref:uncharacterized mitochondrial protein AtMg00860-like n=1 Tax=Carya illinoinensis TaxID=32201 RepID=UPI001C720B6C|nr:uncharacterized mitochondrial protein AtMg00860-like [Carya illinoinensis]